jgi:hypothetical protein
LFDNLSIDEIGFVVHDNKNVTAAAKVHSKLLEHTPCAAPRVSI